MTAHPRVARVRAQAKVNLALRVLAREDSGFHQIETLFCRLELGDEVEIRVAEGERSLECDGLLPPGGLGAPETNLAWRAADAYARTAGWPNGFAIRLTKRIPAGAGLGGGSADAGAVLRALEAMAPAPLGGARLLTLAASLGADVPFLTQDASPLALAWGRGERLLPLAPLPPRRCWLFTPEFPVPTAEAYRWLDASAPSHGARVLNAGALTGWQGVADLAHNDFEGIVGERYPKIAALLEALRSPAARSLVGAAPVVQLSGSGSTVFAVAANPPTPPVAGWSWRSDEPGIVVTSTQTAERVEPVTLTR